MSGGRIMMGRLPVALEEQPGETEQRLPAPTGPIEPHRLPRQSGDAHISDVGKHEAQFVELARLLMSEQYLYL